MSEESIHVLVIDDDRSLSRVLEYQISEVGYQSSRENEPRKAMERIALEHPEIVLTDLRMPDCDGHAVVEFCHSHSPETLVIVMTAFPAAEDAVRALGAGAYDFLVKPVERDALLRVIGKACEVLELRKENARLRSLMEDSLGFDRMVGASPRMREVYARARQVAQGSAPVVLYGETGTGKELLARAIHHTSPRRDAPFIAINCAAIPAELLESELFGHMRGAFTGAVADRKGLVAQAEGGTLFLDEIGELPLALQPKLLRVLQERCVQPLGAKDMIPVDFRLLVATHRNLRELVAEGKFREDLFYRVEVVSIELPPLRDRKEDIPLLFTRFLKMEADREGRAPLRLLPGVLDLLAQRDWPGNVRELENFARKLVALQDGDEVSASDLEPLLARPLHVSPGMSAVDGLPTLPEAGFDMESWIDAMVLAALRFHGGNRTRAARHLGWTRNQLGYRIQSRGLRPEE